MRGFIESPESNFDAPWDREPRAGSADFQIGICRSPHDAELEFDAPIPGEAPFVFSARIGTMNQDWLVAADVSRLKLLQ